MRRPARAAALFAARWIPVSFSRTLYVTTPLNEDRFRMFKIIEKAWRDRTNRSAEAFLLRLGKSVRAIRTTVHHGKLDHRAIALQRYFLENWLHMKQVIATTNIGTAIPASVPYFVLGDFLKRITKATSTTERVLASVEQLSITRPARQKRKHR